MTKKKSGSEELNADITDEQTGEYPALAATAELESAVAAPTEEKTESVKAAFWLTHLETEVSRLHAKWQTIDAEFKTREARIAELHKDVAAREATIGKLNTDLQREAAALLAADERLTSKDGELVALVEDRRTRDERIAALSTELADAEVAHKATIEMVGRAEAEAKRLSDTLRQEQAATAAITERNEQALAEQQRLQGELHDLEIYVNGRHDSWSKLNAELDDCKNALIGMEKTVKARDAVIARHDEEKRALSARIVDLERLCSELTGRRKEREAAFDDLQKKLSAHFEQAEQLKAEYAARAKETEQATKKVVDNQRHIESLERGIKRRDETLETLTTELGEHKRSVSELTALRDKLSKRMDELEKGVSERSQQVQAFRDDLRMSHDQLHTVQQQLSDRTMQLASTQEALEQKSRHLERLNNDLDAVHRDAAEVRAELETLAEHAAELGKLRGAAVAEAEQLKSELAAQRDLIGSLESELRKKQATSDLLERSVDRISDLGASLAALDKEMGTDSGESHEEQSSVVHLADFVATIATDDRAPAAQAATDPEGAELLPMGLLLEGDEPHDNVIDIGERTGIDKAGAARKLVITINGADFDYPLVKNLMTIGRGRSSDIRIASHFVSRVHAKVRTNGIATIIEDAGSKNGILVNSERVKRRILRDGDVVCLGQDLNLRFVDAAH